MATKNTPAIDTQGDFVIFDVETTGLSPIDGDRIVEMAALKIRKFKVVDKFYSFVNPQRDIPSGASNVNGITRDMVADAPTSEVLLPRFLDFLDGSILAGHNIRFDLDFLCYELALSGRKIIKEPVVLDTMKMARDLIPQLGRYPLWRVSNHLGIQTEQTHRAMQDVELTVEVFKRLLELLGPKSLCDSASIEYDFKAFQNLVVQNQQGTFNW